MATHQESCWKKDIEAIFPARLDWPSSIGNFLLNFGTLEYFIFVFLKDRLSPDEFSKVREWHLKDRVTRIARFLKNHNYPAEGLVAFTRLMDRMEELRELRNHIAHGHLLFRIDPDTHTPIVTVFKAKDVDMGYSPESKHLRLEELQTALTTLAEVIEDFQALAGFTT